MRVEWILPHCVNQRFLHIGQISQKRISIDHNSEWTPGSLSSSLCCSGVPDGLSITFKHLTQQHHKECHIQHQQHISLQIVGKEIPHLVPCISLVSNCRIATIRPLAAGFSLHLHYITQQSKGICTTLADSQVSIASTGRDRRWGRLRWIRVWYCGGVAARVTHAHTHKQTEGPIQ